MTIDDLIRAASPAELAAFRVAIARKARRGETVVLVRGVLGRPLLEMASPLVLAEIDAELARREVL